MSAPTTQKTPRSFLQVLEEWNRSRGGPYSIREADLSWNIASQNLVRYDVAQIDETPVIFGLSSEEGLQAGLSARSLWLNLWGDVRKGREDEFINGALALAAKNSRSRLSFGADEFHFAPGIPDSQPALITAAKSAGFTTSDEVDFVGDNQSEAVDQYIAEAQTAAHKGDWRFEQVSSEIELDELHRFLTAEFPGRWTREFVFWRARTDTRRGFWMRLRQGDGPVLGFARMAVRGRLTPLDTGWNPGALRLPHSLNGPESPRADDSCLGPIGVAQAARGQGAGKILLGLVLRTLRENGASRTCIDWTDALKYYLPLKFQIARRFSCAWRAVDGR